jgi:2'-5' RNA ligase
MLHPWMKHPYRTVTNESLPRSGLPGNNPPDTFRSKEMLNMKAAIVLLADHAIQNDARRVVFELNTRYQVPFYASLLPSHVSLKQPFTFENMDVLEDYFDGLAARIAPFQIALDAYYYGEWTGHGILGLHVVETPELRRLHNQINAELKGLFQDSSAPHDGSEYSFHLTIETGKIDGKNGFKEYYDSLPTPRVDREFTARELAMFYYAEDQITGGSFINYRVQPLTG